MTQIVITPYAESDYEDWLQMSLHLFKDYPPEDTERDLKAIQKKDNYQTFMAKSGGTNVGFVTASIRSDYVEGASSFPVGYMEAIYMKSDYRKHGVARKLYEKVESWAIAKGCTEIGSDTWLWNEAAQKFHVQLGFRKEDVLVHYIKSIK